MMKRIAQTGIIALGLMLMSSQGALADKWVISSGATRSGILVDASDPGVLNVSGKSGITTTLSIDDSKAEADLTISIDKTKILVPENVEAGNNTTVTNADGKVTVSLNDSLTGLTNVTTDTITVNESASIGGVLDVTGNAYLKENAEVGKNLTVKGDSVVRGNSTVLGNQRVKKDLTVEGTSNLKDTNVNGKLKVANGAEITGNLLTTGDSITLGNNIVNKNLTVKGNTNLKGKLNVAGEAKFNELVTMLKGLDVTGDATFNDNATIKKNLTVEGTANLKDTNVDGVLDVTGNAYLKENAEVGKNLTVKGDSVVRGNGTVLGNQRVKKDLTVEGTSNLKDTNVNGKLKVANGAEITGNLLTTSDSITLGNSIVNKNLTVKGDTNLKGKLNVAGEAKFNELVTMLKGLDVTGDATFNDNATIKKNLTVEGTANLKDTNVDGVLDVTGDANLHGNATIDKNLTVKGDTNLEGKLAVAGDITLGSTLEVTGATHLKDRLRVNGVASFGNDVTMNRHVTVGGHTSLNSLTVDNKALFRRGADMGGHRVVNVAPGEISSISRDAVTGSQLWEVGERLNKVGARAAAMSNLNPMGYDDNSRTSFAFAVGNYSSETAVALGLHHYFSRDALLSLSGTLGRGSNMVSAGLSFRLGRSSKEALTATAGSIATQTDPFILERLERLEAENAEMRKLNSNMQIQLLKLSQ